ncbi:MAG: hypothetical protein KDI32_02305 [Pseudomonadales bacterium]|nr:hypothetical protein [Pseudomonadales bacterium]
MDPLIFSLSAAGIAVLHTALGPDHYLPFAALGAARRWTIARTLTITAICGVGHVCASLVLAALALGAGSVAMRVTGITSVRGDIAAWLMIAFGVAYAIYGLKFIVRERHVHSHAHAHADGTEHEHGHHHHASHVHPHVSIEKTAARKQSVVAVGWALFIIFLFGPCEPLIPLVMAPASQGAWVTVLMVVSVFAIATIGTMLAIVWALASGLARTPALRAGAYVHSAAGATVAACGAAMLLGL